MPDPNATYTLLPHPSPGAQVLATGEAGMAGTAPVPSPAGPVRPPSHRAPRPGRDRGKGGDPRGATIAMGRWWPLPAVISVYFAALIYFWNGPTRMGTLRGEIAALFVTSLALALIHVLQRAVAGNGALPGWARWVVGCLAALGLILLVLPVVALGTVLVFYPAASDWMGTF